MAVASTLTRTLRRVFPSISRLTYLWPVKIALNLTDLPGRLLFREFRRLPPNHMRIRIGVGWRLFDNQIEFLTCGTAYWFYALNQGFCRMDATILDIGVGCGRYAHHLRDYRHNQSRFTGTYIGIDIDTEMLDWCRANFPVEHFRFHQSPHRASSYNREHASGGYYRIPEPDETVDLVFSTSLFTHLLEDEMRNYLMESYRLLKPGRTMLAYCFCIDYPPPTLGGRHSFQHRLGNAFVESLTQPEAAVAYTEAFLFACAREAGFTGMRMETAPCGWQPMLICQKPAAAEALEGTQPAEGHSLV